MEVVTATQSTSIERYNRLESIGIQAQQTGRRTGEGIVQIGLLLIEAKEECRPGEWAAWLRKYFNASHSTAYRFIKIAREFQEIPNLENYSLSALALLCGDSIEEPVKEAILELGASGEEKITAKLIENIQQEFYQNSGDEIQKSTIILIDKTEAMSDDKASANSEDNIGDIESADADIEPTVYTRKIPEWEIKEKPQLRPERLHSIRHLTALNRMELSAPVKLAIAKGYLLPEYSHLDYGCGTGGDVWRLRKLGYQSDGYDPFFFPSNPIERKDVISLIYVLNVIENIEERTEVLFKCWELTNKVMIVGLRTDSVPSNISEYGDGHITQLGAFQKHYTQEEAIAYLSDSLKIKIITLSSGIFICQKS